MKHVTVRSILLAAAVTPIAWSALADCGSIPFQAPVRTAVHVVTTGSRPGFVNQGSTEQEELEKEKLAVTIDPLEVTVFEPKQRALIAWNGEEEVLLLSTDQKVNASSYSVLEVIPFPSQPTVELGDFETFERAQRLVVGKRTWAVAHGGADAGTIAFPDNIGRIAFEKKMGAHDLAVAQCNNPERFSEFVKDYLYKKYGVEAAAIKPEFLEIIKGYADDGYTWFAFDRIDLTDKDQSRQPIEYRFQFDHVFYPLRISTLEGGVTDVELLVFTASQPRMFGGLPFQRFKGEKQLTISRDEFLGVDETWTDLFPEGVSQLLVNQWSLNGPTKDFRQDLIVR